MNNTPESLEVIFAGMGFLITKSNHAISREKNSIDDITEQGQSASCLRFGNMQLDDLMAILFVIYTGFWPSRF